MVRRLGLAAIVLSLGLSFGWETVASAGYDPNAPGIATSASLADTTDEAWEQADCRVTGTANDLYLALWNRQPAASLSRTRSG